MIWILTYCPYWRFCPQQQHTTSFLHIWYCNVRPKTACSRSSPQLLQKKITSDAMLEGSFCVWLGSLWLEPVGELGRPLSRNLDQSNASWSDCKSCTHSILPKLLGSSRSMTCGRERWKIKVWWGAKNSTGMGSFLYIVWTKVFFVSMSAYP